MEEARLVRAAEVTRLAKIAEEDMLTGQVSNSKDAAGQIIIKNSGTDYSNTISSKWN